MNGTYSAPSNPGQFAAQGREALKQRNTGLVTFTLLAIGIPWGIWTFVAEISGGGSDMVAFNAAAGWYVLLACVYLGLHGLEDMGWCSIPVIITLRSLLSFIVLPTWRFATGADQMDSVYVHAMVLILIAFVALWTGSLILMKRTRLNFVPRSGRSSVRVQLICCATFVVGLVTKFIMWRTGLLSYLSVPGVRESIAESMEWIVFLANLLWLSLAVSAIEVFGKRSASALMKIVLVLSIAFSCIFGLVSGMKQQLFQPLILLAAIFGITRRRIPRSALLLPVLLVVIYPFYNAYRENLLMGYRYESNTLSGLKTVVVKSFDDVISGNYAASGKHRSGFDSSVNRLTVLNDLHDLLSLPVPSLMNGDEKVWMAPVYPFIPRFLWENKPLLNKGQRFSIALGRPMTTSSSMTPVGDIYTIYGMWGVVLAPFLWGICLQFYMNRMTRGDLSERGLLVYLLLLVPLINIENDVASLVAAAVQAGAIAVVLSWLFYGSRPAKSRSARYSQPVANIGVS